MGLLGSGISKLRQLRQRMHRRQIEKLLEDTKKTEHEFVAEAGKLGIDIKVTSMRNYYEILGLGYTTNQKTIKEAYVKLIKQHHPDISKEKNAHLKSEELNEAYATLKDRLKKADYDVKFAKGSNRMDPHTTTSITNELLKRYFDSRKRDYDEFYKRVSTPQSRDSLKAAIEDVADWNRRFNNASNITFDRLWRYGNLISKLDNKNRWLLKSGDDMLREKLEPNLQTLEGMVKAYAEINRGVSAIIESVRNDIAVEENNLAGRLRRSVQ